ncbi:CorA family divalent cation transporter [Roseivivax isoporae]|uniref:Magnesium transporter n=1 Tax=Roseivivax isoporae LMG 25204 TaxID=1449351 RepID=X7FD73_9RHOB|nr:CorA family divalent cation transporter [Roseivivax isoporae]ETX30765.1 magnesium transporter [Roseivivax isoporae LMG 25204]
MIPIFAYDIAPDGTARETGPDAPLPDEGYRWIHCDFTHEGTREWLFAALPERTAEILSQPETRPRALSHAGGLIVLLRGLNLDPAADDPEDMVGLRTWVEPRRVVTVRRRPVQAARDIEAQVREGAPPRSPQLLLVALATNFMGRIEDRGVAMEDRLDALEDLLFADDRHPDRKLLPEMRTAAIRLHRFLGPQASALHALTAPGLPVIDDEAREDLSEIADRAQRAVEEITAVRDRLAALSDHVDLRHGMRLSKNSYVLSVVAAIFLPMSFLTGLFGVNVAGMPGTSTSVAFGLLTLASLALGIVVWLVLRGFRLL